VTKLRAVITVEYEPNPEDYAGNESDGPASPQMMAEIDKEAVLDSFSDFISNFDTDEIKIEVSVVEP
jgi:hypothetical protein